MADELYATLHTTMGDIEVRLFPDHAPKTVANFVGLADGQQGVAEPAAPGSSRTDPLYSGTVFHRVIPNFMIQGGDPLGTGTGGPGYQFKDEFHPELAFDQALPAGDGERRPGHERLAVLHHRRADHLAEPASTPSSARSTPGQDVVDAISNVRDRAQRPAGHGRDVIDSVTIDRRPA